ncbi:MAG: hypothetical protein AAF581_19820 [Planctomycetota bacterium]
MERFGVRGFPTLKFMNSKAEVMGDMTIPSAGGLMAASKGAVQKMGKIQLSEGYRTLMTESAKLEKAMAKKKYKRAIKSITAIEALGRKDPKSQQALEHKAQLTKQAEAKLEEAKGFIESNPKKAKSRLKRIAKDYAGLELAKQAKELAAGIE